MKSDTDVDWVAYAIINHMNTGNCLKPEKLERYSFFWSEARLLVAAIALFKGGVPYVWFLLAEMPFYSLISNILSLAWIISGVASVYLLYRWQTGARKLFGIRLWQNTPDTFAFSISIITGINLGLAGLWGTNIGMTIFYGNFILKLTALIYVVTAVYLYSRWRASGQKIF